MTIGVATVVWSGGLALALLSGSATLQELGDDGVGERGRGELALLVKRCFEEQKAPKTSGLEEKDGLFGLELSAVQSPGVRVLATSGPEEARRVASAMIAARGLFVELTGTTPAFPPGLSAYLLGTPEAKAAFLQKHPKLGPEASARLAKLEGAGVPGTADWAFWEGDAEKRLDALVRFSFDWLFRSQGVTTERHPWLHEGLGFYLTHALVGTHLMWFVQPRVGDVKRDGANVALRSQMDEPGADWMALARGLFADDPGFAFEELLHLETHELEPRDHLRAHALAGYLVEVHRGVLGSVLTRVGHDEDPRVVLEESLGFPLGELQKRLDVWLERREVLVDRAAGRRPEAELLAQWQGLDAGQRRAAIVALRRLVGELDTQQLRWMRAVLPGTLSAPSALEDPPYFDPKVHAPAQPIARKRLAGSDSRVKRLLAQLRAQPDARSPVLSYDYDWGRALVVKLGDPDDPESVFHNALRGFPPEADLARALVLASLDCAEERKAQAAFAHAYTDREGNVFPVSLYEMLGTGEEIERPDVDALGIVHDVLDEWRRWVAPVPGAQHAALYKAINDLFAECRRSRELRLTLAELFLAPSTPQRAGYEKLVLNLHALWASAESDPRKIAALLPDGKRWDAFLAELVARCLKDHKYYALGRRRAAQLRQDAGELRRVLGSALDEGARFVSNAEDAPAGAGK